jgi:hypothetical protein
VLLSHHLSFSAVELFLNLIFPVHSLKEAFQEMSIQLVPPPSEELLALKDLYYATDGPHWRWKSEQVVTGSPWNFSHGVLSHDPCSELWQGVECDCITDAAILKYDHPNNIGSSDSFVPEGYTYYYDDAPVVTLNSTVHKLYCHINTIALIDYGLTGAIPSSFQNLKYLAHVWFSWNRQLSGPILDYLIPHLVHLKRIQLAWCAFTGTMPSSISMLSELEVINLYKNFFHGEFPFHESDKLSKVKGFFLSNNMFSGSVTTLVKNSKDSLFLHQVHGNLFEGTLPDDMFKGYKALYITTWSQNHFTGTFPSSVRSLPKLGLLACYNNQFHGNLVNTFFDSPSWNKTIKTLLLHHNFFTGGLPKNIAQYVKLKTVDMNSNSFSEPIPTGICQLSKLKILDLSSNFMRGPIPDCDLPDLPFFFLSNNQLTGTIPQRYSNSKFQFFDVHNNHLVGSIPHLPNEELQKLYLAYNYLDSTLPSWIFSSPKLQDVLLQQNHFTGEIVSPAFLKDPKFHQIVKNSSITVLDLSSNHLEGSIPPQFFLIPKLKSLALVSNCISGGIPSSVCGNPTLEAVSLDSMNNNEHCAHPVAELGSVPSCLFELPNLETLHLAGLGLRGGLPDHDLRFGASFVNLSISHNQLSGSIPLSFQERQWMNLDFSFNKLSGTLTNNFTMSLHNSSNLQLLSNRLSGDIPSAFLDPRATGRLDILNGNIFHCTYSARSLPRRDPHAGIYSCGTNLLNALLYLWLVFFGIHFVLDILWLRQYSVLKVWKNRKWMKDICQHPLVRQAKDLTQVLTFVQEMYGYLLLLSAVAVVLVCVNVGLGFHFSSYTFKYGFIVSAAYLSGATPVGVLFALWTTLLVFTISCLPMNSAMTMPKLVCSQMYNNFTHKIDLQKVKFFGLGFLICSILIAISLLSNIGFVYSQATYGAQIRNLCQVGMGNLKLIYGRFAIPLSMNVLFSKSSFPPSFKRNKETLRMKLELSLAIIANIILPCVATMLFNINCFYNVLFPAAMIESFYSYYACLANAFFPSGYFFCKKYAYIPISTHFKASFQYSSQCSSAFLSDYVPVFMFMVLLDCFVRPGIIRVILPFIRSRLSRIIPSPSSDVELAPKPVNTAEDKVATSARSKSKKIGNPQSKDGRKDMENDVDSDNDGEQSSQSGQSSKSNSNFIHPVEEIPNVDMETPKKCLPGIKTQRVKKVEDQSKDETNDLLVQSINDESDFHYDLERGPENRDTNKENVLEKSANKRNEKKDEDMTMVEKLNMKNVDDANKTSLVEKTGPADSPLDIVRSVQFNKRSFAMHILIYGSIIVTFGIVFPPLMILICYNSLIYLGKTQEQLLQSLQEIINLTSSSTTKVVNDAEKGGLENNEEEEERKRKQLLLMRLSNQKAKHFYGIIVDLVNFVTIPFSSIFLGYFLVDIYGDQVQYFNSFWIGILFIIIINVYQILVRYYKEPILVRILRFKNYYFNGNKITSLDNANEEVDGINLVEGGVSMINKGKENHLEDLDHLEEEEEATAKKRSTTRHLRVSVLEAVVAVSLLEEEQLLEAIENEEKLHDAAGDFLGLLLFAIIGA